MNELKDLVVVITGSGKGLGKGDAEICYAEGAMVVTWDRSGLAKGVADSLDPSGKRTLYVRADVREEDQVARAFAEIMKKFGRVDVLVNNAGISRHKPLEEMSLELFEEVMKTNVTGIFLCCRAVAPIMKKQGRGKIVNIASLGDGPAVPAWASTMPPPRLRSSPSRRPSPGSSVPRGSM